MKLLYCFWCLLENWKNHFLCSVFNKFFVMCRPQVTIATAIVFSHRFFLRQSHAKNDRRVCLLMLCYCFFFYNFICHIVLVALCCFKFLGCCVSLLVLAYLFSLILLLMWGWCSSSNYFLSYLSGKYWFWLHIKTFSYIRLNFYYRKALCMWYTTHGCCGMSIFCSDHTSFFITCHFF